jgi:hypothetical protein
VVDAQGNSQAITGFEVSGTSGAVGVVEDSTFQPTVTGPLPTERRLVVTANTTDSASVHVTANGVTKDIPVVVNPTSTTAALSTTNVAANQPFTISIAGQPWKFSSTAGANIAGSAGLNLGLSADSTTMTFLPFPGVSGPLVVDSVAPVYAPTLRFSLPTGDSITVGALTPASGTASASTAPPLPVPAAGTTTGFWDTPDFDATVDHFYKLSVTEAGTYVISLNWDLASDLDLILCNDTACSAPDTQAASSNQPESGTYSLTPGTYYVLVEDFGEDASGSTISLTVSH